MQVVHLGGEPRPCCRGVGKRLEGREALFAMRMSSYHCAEWVSISLGTSGPLHGTCLVDVPLEGKEAKTVTVQPQAPLEAAGPISSPAARPVLCAQPGEGPSQVAVFAVGPHEHELERWVGEHWPHLLQTALPLGEVWFSSWIPLCSGQNYKIFRLKLSKAGAPSVLATAACQCPAHCSTHSRCSRNTSRILSPLNNMLLLICAY